MEILAEVNRPGSGVTPEGPTIIREAVNRTRLNAFERAVKEPSNRVTEPHDTLGGWRVLLCITGCNVVDQIALPVTHRRTDAPPPGAQGFEKPARLIEQAPCFRVESGRDPENATDLVEHLLAEAARA